MIAALIAAATTALLVGMRGTLDKAHVALVYLLVILLGSARLGRRTGIMLAILCFVSFNYFLLPPYHTLWIAEPLDWIVLVIFLITSLVATELLHRAQQQAALARARTEEVNRLAALGAETLSVGRAEDAAVAIARVLQTTLDVDSCEIYAASRADGFQLIGKATRNGEPPQPGARTRELFDYVISSGVIIVQRVEGGVHALTSASGTAAESAFTQPDACVIVLPLCVRECPVGLLRLSHHTAIQLSPAQRRFADALAYYAALGVERVALSAEAERAQALAAADRLKDAFIAAVSHDLRTPLTTIKGIAHELADHDERAQTIEVEADRLNRLVADVLDLSRLNAGGLRLQLDVNTADDLIGAALAQLAGLPRAADVDVQLPAGVVAGHFDFVHSLRALVNLVENALKYSPAHARVEIAVAQTDDELILSVLDRGAGIPAADAARMFEPFVRGPAVASATGAGLGLAIAHGLAAAQGGAVRYAPRPGGGSIFSLCLPAASITSSAAES